MIAAERDHRGRDLDQTGGSSCMGRQTERPELGTEDGEEQEPSERKEASWGGGGLVKDSREPRCSSRSRGQSQCPSLRGPSLEEGAW